MRIRVLFPVMVGLLFALGCGQRQPAPADSAAPAPVVEEAAPVTAAPEPLVAPPAAAPFTIEPIAPESADRAPSSSPQEDEVLQPQASTTDAEALIAEWFEVSAEPESPTRKQRLQGIGRALTNLGPEACEPLFEVLARPSEDTMTRYLAVLTLEEWINPTFLPLLDSLTLPDRDETARSYGAYLAGRIAASPAIPLLERLAQDENPSVQFGAELGLARLGEEPYLQGVLDKFRDADTPAQQRAAIAATLADNLDPLLTDFYLEVAGDPTLPAGVRGDSLRALGHIADPSTIPDLQAIAEDPALADQRAYVEFAIQNIQMHESGAIQPFPES